MVNGTTIGIGIGLILVAFAILNFVTIPAIYSGADSLADNINDANEIDENTGEKKGVTGENVVGGLGAVLYIYIVGWLFSILTLIFGIGGGIAVVIKGLAD